MEQFICRPDLLELISIPAYTVTDGIVEAANGGAQNLLITPGTSAEALVETGLEDYRTLADGCCLSLVIRTGEKRFAALCKVIGQFFSQLVGHGDQFRQDHDGKPAKVHVLVHKVEVILQFTQHTGKAVVSGVKVVFILTKHTNPRQILGVVHPRFVGFHFGEQIFYLRVNLRFQTASGVHVVAHRNLRVIT